MQLQGHHGFAATHVAVVMLVAAFTLLLLINLLQSWARKRQGGLA